MISALWRLLRRPGWRLLIRWLFTCVLLAVVFYLVGGRRLADQVQQFILWPAVLALLISIVQVGLSAWRWRFTALRLALPLTLANAVREYYLASFLNQILPGGVAGDANRAWRHGGGVSARGPALRAVVIERFSGQVVLLLVALGCLASASSLGALTAGIPRYGWQLALGVFIVVLATACIRWKLPGPVQAFGNDLRRALFSWPAFIWQWASSCLVLVTYVLVFLLSARAVGVGRPIAEFLPLVPLVLLAMVVPVSVAGWGVREGAAALLWAGAGLPPEEGVLISVGYGVLVLVSTLPGLLVIAGTCPGAASPQPAGDPG